jgi:MYXO-CTERM domain-containing protein
MARVEAIYGKTVNVKVGDRIKVSAPGDVGARVLVPVDPVAEGAASQNGLGFRGISLESDGSYVCKTWGQSSPPLTKAQFVAAVQSDDCGKTLAALNNRWSERVDCRDDAGCSTAPGQASGPTSVGLLLALVSALAWRRRSPALGAPAAPAAPELLDR